MNLLEIVNVARSEASISGGDLPTVASASGERADLVRWVANAYRDICRKRDNWKFLRSSFTLNTAANTQAYLPGACTDTKLAGTPALDGTTTPFHYWYTRTVRSYLQSAGVASQVPLEYQPYDCFRDTYLIRTPQIGVPQAWTIRPEDDALLFGPTPNAVFVITGDYQRYAPDLAADSDTPLFEKAFHDAIMWLAVQYSATKRGDGGQYDAAARNYRRIYFDLERKQAPAVAMAGALA